MQTVNFTTPDNTGTLCIGQTLVDIVALVPSACIRELGYDVGGRQLIEPAQFDLIMHTLKRYEIKSGGSIANTAHALGLLGQTVCFCSAMATDDWGESFAQDLQRSGVTTWRIANSGEGVRTGRLLSLADETGARTMLVCPEQGVRMTKADIDEVFRLKHKRVLLSAYWLQSSYGLTMLPVLLQHAHTQEIPVALSLGDPRVIKAHADTVTGMLPHVNFVCGNFEEYCAWLNVSEMQAILAALKGYKTLFVVTLGEQGCAVINDGTLTQYPAEPLVMLVDTTGAGDNFAAGFLAALDNGYPLETCARLALKMAAAAVSRTGARLDKEAVNTIVRMLEN